MPRDVDVALTLVSWEQSAIRSQRSAFSSQPKLTKSKQSHENAMFPGRCVVKMYYFAIDFGAEMPYPLAPPQGWEASSDL